MKTKIIASAQNWIEGTAIEQLNQTAMLPGMSETVGMPDLHPGKDTPIGAVPARGSFIRTWSATTSAAAWASGKLSYINLSASSTAGQKS